MVDPEPYFYLAGRGGHAERTPKPAGVKITAKNRTMARSSFMMETLACGIERCI